MKGICIEPNNERIRLKFLLLCITGIFIFVPFNTNAQAQSGTNNAHALIIAIGNYPYERTGWRKLSSLNDIPYIKKILKDQGFPEDNISILKDDEATKKGILNAFNDLINKVKRGDVVVIHISSHGEQVADNENKDETDGLDECIVPYDAISPEMSEDFIKDQANYLRDDEFGVIIDDLRMKVGPGGDVIVFLDNCFSGSGTRGTAIIRGDQPPLVPKDFKKSYRSKTVDRYVFNDKPVTHNENSMAGYTVISASKSSENNYETTDENGNGVGSLTYNISKAFQQLENQTTYRTLFARIVSLMQATVPNQNPTLEGTGVDRLLFGGKYISQKTYFEVSKIEEESITVEAGIFAGMDKGAKVEFYPAGTIDPGIAEKTGSGWVSNATAFQSSVISTDSIKETNPKNIWVFLKESVFAMKPVRLQIFVNPKQWMRGKYSLECFTAEEEIVIKNALCDFPQVIFSDTPDLIYKKGIEKDKLIIASTGSTYKNITNGNTEELKKTIKQFTQYKFLQIDIPNANIQFEIKLIPVKMGIPDTTLLNNPDNKGVPEFKLGETLSLWVKNKGKDPVYFNILDLQPDGIFRCLLPNKEKKIYKEDLFIPAGVSLFDFKKFRIELNPPHGLEVFKIFVSTSPLDLESITQYEGSARGNLAPFEKLLNNSYEGTRGAKLAVPASEGSTFSYPFKILER